jgi:GYF domain 2
MEISDDSEWYFSRNGKQGGPISGLQIKLLHREGKLLASDDVWTAELGDWKKAGKVFRFGPPPPPPPSPPEISDPPQPIAAVTSVPASAGTPLITTMRLLGGLAIAGAFVWWLVFYTSVSNALGGSNPPPISGSFKCLFFTSGECAMISAVAQLAGYTPYQPIVFWLGAGALLFATVYKLFSTSSGSQQTVPALQTVRLYTPNGREVVVMPRGHVVVRDKSDYLHFPSVSLFRQQYNDQTQWNEITDFDRKQSILGSWPSHIFNS